jgi:hypothetical protein
MLFTVADYCGSGTARVAKGQTFWELSMGSSTGEFGEFCLNSSRKLAYNHEPFFCGIHKAILGLVAYFG